MILNKRISNWFIHFKKYFFTYKNGFFEVSYLANSPKSMVESLKKMPFNKYEPCNNSIETKNLFLDSCLQYFEIEDGLWVFVSKIKYKKNILYKRIFDEFIPVDYYMLNFNSVLIDGEASVKPDKAIDVENHSWLLLKPKIDDFCSNFKNSLVENFFVCFSDDWIRKHLKNTNKEKSIFLDFINDNSLKKIEVKEILPDSVILMEKIKSSFSMGEKLNSNWISWEAERIIGNFIDYINNDFKRLDSIVFKKDDYVKILRIKYYILSNLNRKFMGIGFLSEKFNISPTKLKKDFKILAGYSIFKYFQIEQMKFAKKVIQNNDLKVKEIARDIGYENASKFSIAFKKVHKFSPKEFK